MNNCIYKISNEIITKKLDDKLLVTSLSGNNDHVYEIAGSGIDIWRVLEKGASLASLIEALKDEWEEFGDPEHQEIDQFLKELVKNQLVFMVQE